MSELFAYLASVICLFHYPSPGLHAAKDIQENRKLIGPLSVGSNNLNWLAWNYGVVQINWLTFRGLSMLRDDWLVIHRLCCELIKAVPILHSGSTVLYSCAVYGCGTQNSGIREILMLLHWDHFSRVIWMSLSEAWGALGFLGVLQDHKGRRSYLSLQLHLLW